MEEEVGWMKRDYQADLDLCKKVPGSPWKLEAADNGAVGKALTEFVNTAPEVMPYYINRAVELEKVLGGVREALESAHNTMAFDARDWALDKRDAWLYGLITGWDDEEEPEEDAMGEVARKHRWSDYDVARLRRLHQAIVAIKEVLSK
jgi:hypothetical protein